MCGNEEWLYSQIELLEREVSFLRRQLERAKWGLEVEPDEQRV